MKRSTKNGWQVSRELVAIQLEVFMIPYVNPVSEYLAANASLEQGTMEKSFSTTSEKCTSCAWQAKLEQ
jgi:hypothetical protein